MANETKGFGVAVALAMVLGPLGCGTASVPRDLITPSRRGGVTFIRPRCAGVESCLLGQVVAAESATPLARAAVFLERERDDGDDPVRFLTLTDDQGVFIVTDAPKGRYRLAVYKDARRVEARGLKLGSPGTTVVPVRLPST